MKKSLVVLLLALGAGGSVANGEAALDLTPVPPVPVADWMVGGPTVIGQKAQAASKTSQAPDWDVSGLSLTNLVEAPHFATPVFLNVFDYHDLDSPEIHTDEVYLLAPTGRLQPFAVVARQSSQVDDEITRLGYGTGAKLNLSRNADLGTEVVLFPKDREWTLEREGAQGVLGDWQVFARLEIRF